MRGFADLGRHAAADTGGNEMFFRQRNVDFMLEFESVPLRQRRMGILEIVVMKYIGVALIG